MTKEELDLVERELELEERKAALQARKLENQKLLREADAYRMEQENKEAQNRRKGEALEAQRPSNKFAAVRKTCNHKMGGKGRESLMTGRGNDAQYAVVKIKLPTGDVMIRCQRCRDVWVPAFEEDYYFGKDGKPLAKDKGGKFDREAYKKAQDRYNEAYNFDTDLAMVVLPQYRWARGGKPINREVTHRFVKGLVS